MAIHPDHEFKKEHGYTGSANHSKDHRPKMHGYKYGGDVSPEMAEDAGKHMKHGSFVNGAKEHFGKSGHVDHDGEQHMGKACYDESGFQHLKHGGKAKHHKK